MFLVLNFVSIRSPAYFREKINSLLLFDGGNFQIHFQICLTGIGHLVLKFSGIFSRKTFKKPSRANFLPYSNGFYML